MGEQLDDTASEPRGSNHREVHWHEGLVYAAVDAVNNHCCSENRTRLDTTKITKHRDIAAAARTYRMRYGFILHATLAAGLPFLYLYPDFKTWHHVALPIAIAGNLGLVIRQLCTYSTKNLKRTFWMTKVKVKIERQPKLKTKQN